MISLRLKVNKSPCACWERSEQAWRKLSSEYLRSEEEEHEAATLHHQRCQHHHTPQETPSLSVPYVEVFGALQAVRRRARPLVFEIRSGSCDCLYTEKAADKIIMRICFTADTLGSSLRNFESCDTQPNMCSHSGNSSLFRKCVKYTFDAKTGWRMDVRH